MVVCSKKVILLFIVGIVLLLSSFIHKDLNEYGKWCKFYNLNSDDFIKKDAEQKITADWKPYDLSSEDKKLYDFLFFYSPDSNYFLDIDSYSIILDKDAKGKLTWGGGDPESKVQLINTKNQKSQMLLYFGTHQFPETAIWRNNFLFEVMGFTITDEVYIPTLWKFNLQTNSYQVYQNKKTFSVRPKSYLTAERLKNIKER